ncbi:hypothetical protein HanRHA438_Chr04g0184561 [Helianthus annuus]|nr:hypothetical protein HanRHA438_Chr04g0184561 [Helianthus annuus]
MQQNYYYNSKNNCSNILKHSKNIKATFRDIPNIPKILKHSKNAQKILIKSIQN